MGLLQVVIVLVVIAIGLGLLNKYGPAWFEMDAKILRIINIVVVLAVVIWLLAVFGVFDSMNSIRIGRG